MKRHPLYASFVWIALAFVLLSCSSSKKISTYYGGSTWPYINYAKAQLYVFNQNYPAENETKRPETSIVTHGEINPTATYVGEIAFFDMLNIVEILSQSSDLVAKGLSKCFIPRHGVVLYDQADSIVAHLSICFECDQIVASPPIRYKKVTKENVVWKEKDIKKAEFDIQAIEAVITKYHQN